MTSGPKVRLGTKRPSITSHWMRSTPAFSRAATSSPSRAKSAGSTDGAISIAAVGSRVVGHRAPSSQTRSLAPWSRRSIEITDGRRRAATGSAATTAGGWSSSPGALPGETVAVELVPAEEGLRPRPRRRGACEASPDRVEPPCPFVADGLRWLRLAARRARRPAPAQGGGRRRRAAPPGPPRRRRSTRARRCRPTGYRTTVRGVASDGRFGFRRRQQPRRRRRRPVPGRPPAGRRARRGRALPRRRGRAPGRRRHRRAPGRSSTSTPDGADGARRASGSSSAAELAAGRRAWFHEEVAGRRWRISARSFFQARPDGAEALVDAVARRARRRPAGRRAPRRPLRRRRAVRRHARRRDGPVTLVEQSASSAADARVEPRRTATPAIVRADVDHWGAAPRRRRGRRPAPHRPRRKARRPRSPPPGPAGSSW